MLQGFEQKNEQKYHFKMKINKEFPEAHKLSRKPETLAGFARRRTQQQQQMKKELKTETTKRLCEKLETGCSSPLAFKIPAAFLCRTQQMCCNYQFFHAKTKRSQIVPPLHLARKKRKSRRCPFLCATHYSDVRNRSANIKHTMKLWLEKKRSYLFS
jgi:hypothetical protein